MARVLVVYDGRAALIRGLAQHVGVGVALVRGATPVLLDVEDADQDELLEADALILGSPNWTGVTGRLKSWLDESGDLWESGDLAGKPGGAFAAGWSPRGGLEVTLQQILHLLVGHGMVFVGLQWTERMRRSGSFYGATAAGELTNDDREQARTLGWRVATLAVRLEASAS